MLVQVKFWNRGGLDEFVHRFDIQASGKEREKRSLSTLVLKVLHFYPHLSLVLGYLSLSTFFMVDLVSTPKDAA